MIDPKFDAKIHLQFWDQTPPSKRDALLILTSALDLLAECLPIAIDHIGQRSPARQHQFWEAFSDFNDRTDVGLTTEDQRWGERMAEKIHGWREIVELRSQPDTATRDLRSEDAEHRSGPKQKAKSGVNS